LESRIRAALLLYAFFVLGLFLLVAPWTVVWSRAVVGLLPTAVGRVAQSGWLRGLVSGLGALNLVFALDLALELWQAMRGTRSTEG
jgi:hypothetical protein